jgi:hypothetical protein
VLALSADRLESALRDLKRGVSTEEVCQRLSWRDFEAFGEFVLSANGYRCVRNVHLRSPRAELDLVSWTERLALVVDCKHWRYLPPSRLSEVTKAQAARVRRLRNSPVFGRQRPQEALPAILALRDPPRPEVGGVPVVAASRLDTFARDVEGYLHLYHTVRLHGPGPALA